MIKFLLLKPEDLGLVSLHPHENVSVKVTKTRGAQRHADQVF